jgi:hypothetical protein
MIKVVESKEEEEEEIRENCIMRNFTVALFYHIRK